MPGKGTLAASAARAGKRVAAGKRSVSGGSATVKLRFTKQARKSLRHARRVKLAVKVTFTPESGAAVLSTTSITLKR